ncbi:MAG TPA: hypothetical protein VK364_03055 [Hymenobacter sp.]|nr:hypothetical protein [Hymenobacter sp.]
MHSGKEGIVAEEGEHSGDGAGSLAATETEEKAIGSKRQRLEGVVVTTAVKLLPLVKLLDAIQPHVTNESVFRTRRKKINAQIALVYEQLQEERPKRKKLTRAFKTMSELVREEARDISKDELKEATKEFVLATLMNAPAIINAAHQAKLLS